MSYYYMFCVRMWEQMQKATEVPTSIIPEPKKHINSPHVTSTHSQHEKLTSYESASLEDTIPINSSIHSFIHSFIACRGRLGMNKEYAFGKVLTCKLQWKNLRSGFYGPVLDLGYNNYIIIFLKHIYIYIYIYNFYHIILYYIIL
jgi:hypothetical protein